MRSILLGRLISEPCDERIGSRDDDESARLPLVEGLPSDWSGLLCLEKVYKVATVIQYDVCVTFCHDISSKTLFRED